MASRELSEKLPYKQWYNRKVRKQDWRPLTIGPRLQEARSGKRTNHDAVGKITMHTAESCGYFLLVCCLEPKCACGKAVICGGCYLWYTRTYICVHVCSEWVAVVYADQGQHWQNAHWRKMVENISSSCTGSVRFWAEAAKGGGRGSASRKGNAEWQRKSVRLVFLYSHSPGTMRVF